MKGIVWGLRLALLLSAIAACAKLSMVLDDARAAIDEHRQLVAELRRLFPTGEGP